MNRLYRQLPFVLLLLAATIGCTRNDEALIEEATPILTFRPTLEGMEIVPSTRSTVNEVDIATLGFSVVGYHTEEQFPLSDAATASLVPNIFDKIDDTDKSVVRTVNVANNWKLPLAKIALDDLESSVRTQFSFFAWTAAASTDATGTSTSVITKSTTAATDKGYPFLDITLPAPDAQEQGDVVVAHALNAPNDYVVTAVDLDFHHALSKLSICAKAISGAVVTVKSTAVRYAANSIYTKARYEFNASDSVGCWKSLSAPQAAGDVTPYGFNTPSLGPTTSFLGSLLMIPQECKSGALSLVLNYTVTIDGNVSEPITRVLPIEIDLCQGKHYTYTLNIETDRLELINLSVGEWRDAGKAHPMPIIPGAMSDVLLLLEGYDKPYRHSDNNWYWLDRSGYNRHCEIKSYNANMYSELDRSYEFNSGAGRKLIVPPLGSVTELTMDVVAQEVNTNSTQVISSLSSKDMSGNNGSRQFFVHIGWSSNYIVLDTEGTTANPSRFMTTVSLDLKQKLMWTFQKKDGKASSVFHNALLLGTAPGFGSGELGALNYNLIAPEYNGRISHVKISRTEQSAGEISKDFASVMQRYKIDKIQGKYLPAVTDGLFACWDGRSGLLDHNGGNGDGAVWVDQAGEGLYMTAVVRAGINGSMTHDATEKAIVSVSPKQPKPSGYMINETKFDTELTEITFETVSLSGNVIYLDRFMEILDSNNRSILIVSPLAGNYGTALSLICKIFNSPNELQIERGATASKRKRSVVYTLNIPKGTMKIYENGNLLGEAKDKVSNVDAFKISKMFLFNDANRNRAFTGNIYAYRIYNRELTLDEIKRNYDSDKITFSLP